MDVIDANTQLTMEHSQNVPYYDTLQVDKDDFTKLENYADINR